MKKLIVLLLFIAGAVTMVPTQAEAGDRRRHYRNYDRHDHGYHYRRPVVRHRYYAPRRVYYAPRPVYYEPCYYQPAPVYYSRPRSSFSFTIVR